MTDKLWSRIWQTNLKLMNGSFSASNGIHEVFDLTRYRDRRSIIDRDSPVEKKFEYPYNRIWYKQDAIGNIEILFFIWLDKDSLPGILNQDLFQVVEKSYRSILSRGYITIAVLTSLVFIIAFAKIKVKWNTVTIAPPATNNF